MNVSCASQQRVQNCLANPDPSLFDDCQKQVFDLMKYDCMVKFKATQAYKQAKSKQCMVN